MIGVRLGFLTALGLAAATVPAAACSCAPVRHDTPLPPILVEATVLSYTVQGTGAVANIRVHRTLKGAIGRRARVHTAAHPAACGVVFRPGERLRIGMNRHQGRYVTNSCIQFHVAPPR